MTRIYWSEEEEELLKKVWLETEYDLYQIAELFGRTRDSICNKAHKIGLPKRINILAEMRIRRIREKLREMTPL